MSHPKDTTLEAGVASMPQSLVGTPLLARTFQGLQRREGRQRGEGSCTSEADDIQNLIICLCGFWGTASCP